MTYKYTKIDISSAASANVYIKGIGYDNKWFVRGPGIGTDYYSGTMYPHMRLSNEKDCEAAVLIACEAYRQGWLAAKKEIRESLGLGK